MSPLTDGLNTLPPFFCITERGGYDTDEEDAIREHVKVSAYPTGITDKAALDRGVAMILEAFDE